jgi:hypothetical protein
MISLCLLAGCSARDPVTQTPVYHIGTPTNRSSVNSWELSEPVPQSGIYHGKAVHLKSIASQRGFEPDDPTAQEVMNTLTQSGVSTQYLSARAKNGVVILTGSVTTAAQKSRAEQLARTVPGVKRLDNRVVVIKP